jgi:enoyl-CoA hydratase
MGTVSYEQVGPVAVITLQRPEVRNAVNGPTAAALVGAFERFEADEHQLVAILTGAGGNFCAGADLKAIGTPDENKAHPLGPGPMGPTRMTLSKPVIAAVEGFAVAGGLELALWCDLRVAASDATFGVFCRRWGVPLIDGGTVRLPRLIGHSRAMDMILTGRAVAATEAFSTGLVNRVSEPGGALAAAMELAAQLSSLPQGCLRSDRLSAMSQWAMSEDEAMEFEFATGFQVLMSGESQSGAARFRDGSGRHGASER